MRVLLQHYPASLAATFTRAAAYTKTRGHAYLVNECDSFFVIHIHNVPVTWYVLSGEDGAGVQACICVEMGTWLVATPTELIASRLRAQVKLFFFCCIFFYKKWSYPG